MTIDSCVFAVDTSSLISLIKGDDGADVQLLMKALHEYRVILPSVVLVEAYSNKETRTRMEGLLSSIKQMELQDGFWYRASELRAEILFRKCKANVADTLIAQSCIDYSVPLITRDSDFRNFVKYGKLKLAVG